MMTDYSLLEVAEIRREFADEIIEVLNVRVERARERSISFSDERAGEAADAIEEVIELICGMV